MYVGRRRFLAGIGTFGMAALLPAVGHAARVPVAGFAPEPWFAETTFDLAKDLVAANAAGKTLALLWEQKGCRYCREMHKVNFQEPEIVAFGKKHFHIVQMDLWGDRDFIDFDGVKRKESKIAAGRSVRGTPVTLFFGKAGDEVFRMPGYAKPPLFLAVYRYVVEKGYELSSLRDWIKARGAN